MTKTEQLQAAWHTLQCNNLIKEMLIEVSAKGDEISASLKRLELVGDQTIQEERQQKLSCITQQMALLNITPEELSLHIADKKKYRQKKPKAGMMHVATYMGKEVFKGKPLPKVATDAGWNRINKIPTEYWTQEYKDHMQSIGKYQPE